LPAPVSAVQALALGLPAAYIQGYGVPDSNYGSQELSLFVQDDWRIGSVTLKLGVRYQNQFWPKSEYSARGLSSYSFPVDNNNIAPRLGFAWNPAGGAMSIHAAYGTFYDNQLTSLPGISNILDGADGVRTFVTRLPQSRTAWNAPGRRLPEEAVGSFPSLVFIPGPGLKTPYAHHVATGINGRLPWGMSIAGDFVFVRGLHQVGTLDYNPIVPALGSGRRPEDSVDPSSGLPMPGTSASILQQTSFGETWYRGFTLSLAKRKGGATQFLMSYTLSKAEDNTTDFQSAFIPENLGQGRNPSDPNGLPVGFDPNDERGPSLQDQRHRLVFSGQYVLPGKIQASSILTLASGRPYNILAGSDLNGDGNGGAFPPDRARRDPADPASSVMRNSGKLPGQATVDLRISRKFGVSEDVGTEVMLDMFNLFNRTNFTEINNIFGVGAFPDSPLATFGQFEAAGSPFQAQLGLRLRFK
jgi:hypothetical protein